MRVVRPGRARELPAARRASLLVRKPAEAGRLRAGHRGLVRPQYPVDRRYRGYHERALLLLALAAQQISDFPREQGGRLTLELDYPLYHLRRGHLFGLGASDGSRPDGASLVEAGEDFAHAAMAHQELARYIAGPNSDEGELDDPLPDVQGQRPAVDEQPAELVDSGLTCALISGRLKVSEGC